MAHIFPIIYKTDIKVKLLSIFLDFYTTHIANYHDNITNELIRYSYYFN